MVFSGAEAHRILSIPISYDHTGPTLHIKIIIFPSHPTINEILKLQKIKSFGNEKYNKFSKKFYNEDKLHYRGLLKNHT